MRVVRMANGLLATAVVLVALSDPLMAQIPKEAQWEITFAQVEAALGLPDLSKAELHAYEARVMQRPWRR